MCDSERIIEELSQRGPVGLLAAKAIGKIGVDSPLPSKVDRSRSLHISIPSITAHSLRY